MPAPAVPEPEVEYPAIPYEMQIASVTPERREQILEKKTANSDSVGWLTVPGTTIDDVVLQNPIMNNDYYTTHDFKNQPSKNGAYGMDWHFKLSGATTRESFPRNTVLYAHNHDDDPDGILFAQLKKFKDPIYAEEHPYIFFSTAEEDMAWEIFAVFDATIDFSYIQPGVYWSSFEPLLQTVYEASIYDYDFTVSEDDKLLTLSTCTFSVPGNEAMPVNALNDYRFVIMARLVSPEEQIKAEADFTHNGDPTPPDDLPPYNYLTYDAFSIDGKVLFNNLTWYNSTDCVEPIDPGRLVPAGIIEKSNLDNPVRDWEASQLPEGTVILKDPEYADLYVADVGWDLIPYTTFVPGEMPVRSVRYTHQNRDGIITDKRLDAGQLDEHLEKLDRFTDMVNFKPWPDDMAEVRLSEYVDEVRLAVNNSFATLYQYFFLGTAPSSGEKIMIIRQSDGLYYGDGALYAQLKETLDAMYEHTPQMEQ